MFLVFTGNGKGKTTAALGQAFRAVGDSKRVLMVQFIKGPWRSGEDESQTKLQPLFKIVKMGKGFVGIGDDTLPRSVHVEAAEQALTFAHDEAASGHWDMIILDEVNNAIHLGLISIDKTMKCIDDMLPHIEHLICTGRDCLPELVAKADLVTEMREIKHPFEDGITGKKGLEY